MDFDTRLLRNALGSFATGVTVVTALDDQGVATGITANSFSSVSLEPPLVLWCVGRDSKTFPVFSTTEYFAIHILHTGQADVSQRFADPDSERFQGLSLETGIADLPLLTDYCARFQCRVEHRYEGGDHLILVARVLSFDYSPAEPLVFHNGSYRQISS